MKNHANATPTCASGASFIFQPFTCLTQKSRPAFLAAFLLGLALLLAVPAKTQTTNCPCFEGYEVGNPENPTSVDIDGSSLPEGGLTGGCVVVYGKLVVDEDYFFDGTLLTMEAGAEIEVVGNHKLTLRNGTVLRGCERMWKGISLIQFSDLDMEESIIEDAQYAVKATHLSSIRLVNNTFDANYVGFYVPPPGFGTNTIFKINNLPGDFKDNHFVFQSAYLPPYSGQSPDPYILPLAGILLNSANTFVVGHPTNGNVPNFFSDLRYGIIDNKGYANIFSGCQMDDLDSPDGGVGVLIEENKSKITVRNCAMTDVRFGVFGKKHQKLDILSNSIEASHSGIELTKGTNSALIKDNTIVAKETGDGNGDCIEIHQSSNGSNAIEIKNNDLTPRYAGVHAWNIQGKFRITDQNRIHISYPIPAGVPGVARHGLHLYQNAGPMLVANTTMDFPASNAYANTCFLISDCTNAQFFRNIFSSPTGFDTPSPTVSLGVRYSTDQLFCCNNLGGSKIGASFIGTCDDTRL